VSYFPPLDNIVRSAPGIKAREIGYLKPGEEMDIIGGPACEDGMFWWEVRSQETNVSGWTAEGDIDYYWLVPLY
jgi:hypothetical protein